MYCVFDKQLGSPALRLGFKYLLVVCICQFLHRSSGETCGTQLCTCNAKLIQILFSSLSVSIAAGPLNVNTFGDGTTTLVCSADGGVVNMQWSVSYSGMSRAIDLDTILASATENLTVTEGITLSSTRRMDSIQSTMTISSGSNRVASVLVTFVCSGRTQSGGSTRRFRNTATVTVALPNPTTAPSTIPTVPLIGQLQVPALTSVYKQLYCPLNVAVKTLYPTSTLTIAPTMLMHIEE